MVTTAKGNHTILTSSVDRPVSPIELDDVFEPVQHTIQKLSLLELHDDMPFHESRIDFSEFSALKNLEMSCRCLIPQNALYDKQRNIAKLLPPGLWQLKVLRHKHYDRNTVHLKR